MVLSVALAFALTAQQSTPPPAPVPKPLGTFDDPIANPTHPLKSVGVRGTIDAGGYAASAEVKSRSEFYEQLADLQVAALHAAWAPPNPCDAANLLRMAAIRLLVRGEFSKAATALEVLERTDDRPATHQLLGLAYEGSGQLEAAAEQFRVAAKAQPDAAALVGQGAALLFLGEVDQAEAVFRRASQQSGDQAVAKLGLGAALFQHGKIAEALGLFLDAASAGPVDNSAFGFIAVALRATDPATLARSIDALTDLTRRLRQSAGAHYALACALMVAAGAAPDSAQSAGIEIQLKEAVKLDPQFADAHFRLAEVYSAREELPSAIAEYRSALDHNPEVIEAHYRLSQLYARTGQPELSREQLALHQQLRARQKSEVESGKIRLHFPGVNAPSCVGGGG